MLKADPSILRCKVRWNVSRKCVCRKPVGLMGIGSGHIIFELNRRGDEDFTDTRNRMGV
jgi:hypothetical protein